MNKRRNRCRSSGVKAAWFLRKTQSMPLQILVVNFITQFLFEALEFLLAQRVKAFSIVLGHVETVDDDLAFHIVVILEKIGSCF